MQFEKFLLVLKKLQNTKAALNSSKKQINTNLKK